MQYRFPFESWYLVSVVAGSGSDTKWMLLRNPQLKSITSLVSLNINMHIYIQLNMLIKPWKLQIISSPWHLYTHDSPHHLHMKNNLLKSHYRITIYNRDLATNNLNPGAGTTAQVHLTNGPDAGTKSATSLRGLALALLSLWRASSNARHSFSCTTRVSIVGLWAAASAVHVRVVSTTFHMELMS
jgi:hypothetical protein